MTLKASNPREIEPNYDTPMLLCICTYVYRRVFYNTNNHTLLTLSPISHFRSSQLFDGDQLAPHLTDQRNCCNNNNNNNNKATVKMKMRLLTFVNCSSFEMRTKRQLNLSCAPFVVCFFSFSLVFLLFIYFQFVVAVVVVACRWWCATCVVILNVISSVRHF